MTDTRLGARLESFRYYHYNPSQVAAALAFILILVATVYHTWKMIKTRTWFWVSFVIGGFFEFIGYAGRIASARQTPDWTLTPYLLQSLLLLLGPALFAASVYMVFGRLIRMLGGERYCIIRVNWLTKLFVLGDALSFLVQCGASVWATNLVLVGLLIQVIFFGLFIVACAVFHRRMLSSGYSGSSTTGNVSWQQYMLVLYTASVLIAVRSIFGIAKYAGGSGGVLTSSEVCLYVFDTLLMFGLMAVFVWKHPSEVIARKGMSYGMAPLG